MRIIDRMKKNFHERTLSGAKTLLIHMNDKEFGTFLEGVIAFRKVNAALLTFPIVNATKAELNWAKHSPLFAAELERRAN